MLITRIELENIKSYHKFVVDFRRGTTAISGENGAGKTTLVEAIGYALFDYLPYSQGRFVREGEKHGHIVIHLIGGDERPYSVERRCGSGARWFIHDEEANMRIEQSADVLDKLHELFGIDRARPLDSLFRDALGVPQGTFTAIFLETPSKRKQTFDALLQIEDYKTAADYLLETQHEYKDQRQAQQARIDQLTFETRELTVWREQLTEARVIDEQWKQLNAQWAIELMQLEERLIQLTEQYNRLQALKNAYETSKTKYESAQHLLAHHEQQLQQARSAHQAVNESHADYQRYQQAEEALQQLRQNEQQRSALRQQQATLQSNQTRVQTNLENLQQRLQEVDAARQQVVTLAPLVDQQIELEKQRDDLKQKCALYINIVSEGKQLSGRQASYRRKKEELEQKITEIEPLLPIADRLQEHTQTLMQLQVQRNQRKNKLEQLQEKRNDLQKRQSESELLASKLRQAEKNLTIIEEHRSEAEEMPLLQERFDLLLAQQHRLEGNIEGYAKSRAQSAGGQCPLLNESCLNIKQRGLMSLEAYFENLLQEEQAQMADVRQQQRTLTERMGQIKKYADALVRLDQYVERRETAAEQVQRNDLEIARLKNDVANLTQELDALQTVEQQLRAVETAYNESKSASTRVRDLPGLQKQVQQLVEQIQQCEQDLQERRQKADALRGSESLLKGVEAELAQLNDPRSRSRAQQNIIAQEGSHLEQQRVAQQRALELHQRLQDLQQQLAVYETLDADIAKQDALLQISRPGYHTYLKYVEVARTLPERERAYQQQLETTEQAQRTLQETERSYQSAQAHFDETELLKIKDQLDRLRKDLAALAEKMQHHQKYMNELGQKIAEAEEKLTELEAARNEYQELDDLHTMTEYFRKLIKEAAPFVLKAMLNDISAEANRIFGEIMGDRSAHLSWQNDYEIILRRQGVNRTFAQLSGGEQMSAALAVRLALLKKLSTLNLAFFDEPTQNMDELRRMNLAEQIRRVRGFEQLIVISHDDTFEQGLDSLIRLRKDSGGETRLQNEDALPQAAREPAPNTIWGQDNVYAAQ
jgi:exonuclease SbcC